MHAVCSMLWSQQLVVKLNCFALRSRGPRPPNTHQGHAQAPKRARTTDNGHARICARWGSWARVAPPVASRQWRGDSRIKSQKPKAKSDAPPATRSPVVSRKFRGKEWFRVPRVALALAWHWLPRLPLRSGSGSWSGAGAAALFFYSGFI
jgi:hypothetical protein